MYFFKSLESTLRVYVSVPSKVCNCANAQYHQTICAVLYHPRAIATFQIKYCMHIA